MEQTELARNISTTTIILLIGVVFSLSSFFHKDVSIAVTGLTLIFLVSSYHLIERLFLGKRRLSSNLDLLWFLISYFVVSKTSFDKREINGVKLNLVLSVLLVLMFVFWVIGMGLPKMNIEVSGADELVLLLNSIGSSLFRMAVLVLIIVKIGWLKMEAIPIEGTVFFLAILVNLTNWYFDFYMDKSVAIKYGVNSAITSSSASTNSFYQLIILGALFLTNALNQDYWRYYLTYLVAVTIILTYLRYKGAFAPISRINNVFGFSARDLEKELDLNPDTISKKLRSKGFVLDLEKTGGNLKKFLDAEKVVALPVGRKTSSLLLINYETPKEMALIPASETKQLLQEIGVKKLDKLSEMFPVSKEVITTILSNMEVLNTNLSSLKSFIENAKTSLLKEIWSTGTLVSIKETKDKSEVKIPGIVEVHEYKDFSVVKTFGLKIFDHKKIDIVDGWITVVEGINEFTYFNILGLVKGLVNEETDEHVIEILGFKIVNGYIGVDLNEFEKKMREKLDLFWQHVSSTNFPEAREHVLKIEKGEIKALPVEAPLLPAILSREEKELGAQDKKFLQLTEGKKEK